MCLCVVLAKSYISLNVKVDSKYEYIFCNVLTSEQARFPIKHYKVHDKILL